MFRINKPKLFQYVQCIFVLGATHAHGIMSSREWRHWASAQSERFKRRVMTLRSVNITKYRKRRHKTIQLQLMTMAFLSPNSCIHRYMHAQAHTHTNGRRTQRKRQKFKELTRALTAHSNEEITTTTMNSYPTQTELKRSSIPNGEILDHFRLPVI